jgi:lysine-N-methylase
MTKRAKKNSATPKYFTETMLVPKYVTQFQCVGAKCPDTCCANWTITIDKDTFQTYRRVVQPQLKPLIQEYLVQVDKDSYANHGKIVFGKTDSRCGLNSKEGMCIVQQQLGEDALSDTCYTYPRSVVHFGDHFEQSLTLSCPEAARLALTQEDSFDFVSAEFTARLATTSVLAPVNGYSLAAMHEVHIFVVQLFQTPTLSNTERLVTLGWLSQQIDHLVATNAQSEVDTLLTEMRKMVESGNIHAAVELLNPQQAASVTLFSILFGMKPPDGTAGNQREILDKVRSGLEITAEPDLLRISDNYVRGSKLVTGDGGTCERLVCRYLLNDVIRETFPWTRASAMEHYRRLLSRYGILRLMLAGVAAAHGQSLNEAVIVQTIQVFCRIYQHNTAFATRAENILTQSDWTGIEQLYALLN